LARLRRHCFSNFFLLLLGLLPGLTACGPARPQVSERGRSVCQREASQAASPRAFSKLYSTCLEGVEARLAREDQVARQTERKSAEVPVEAPASAAERYQHCFFKRDDVIATYREQFALQGPAISLTNQYGYNDERSIEARSKQEKAYERLELLIPERMRAGKPLMPDSVEIFQRCDSADFFP
jgi:hypothetical protein